jgi:hypothetical protein
MNNDRRMKISVEIPHEGSKMEFSFPRDAPLDELITVFRTVMTYMAWHPDITESMFKREFLEDNCI